MLIHFLVHTEATGELRVRVEKIIVAVVHLHSCGQEQRTVEGPQSNLNEA